MLVVLSPAKKLSVEGDKPSFHTLPEYTAEAEKLITVLQKKKEKALQKLMGISPALAELNYERYQTWTPEHSLEDSKQAVLTFTGEVYNGLNAASFSDDDYSYAQDHLRLLSGLYGVLKPMDLVHAYRLEMGTSLKIRTKKNLYEFWGDKIAKHINGALENQGDDVLINLASNEYFKAIDKKKLKARVITPVFKDFKNGEYKTIMVYAKKARGMMAAYIIKNKIKEVEHLIGFDTDGYCYSEAMSSDDQPVFIRG